MQLSIPCRDQYKRALAADLLDVSRLVNEKICNRSMCSYLTGAPGTGVVVDKAAIVASDYNRVYAAIDTSGSAVSFDFDDDNVSHQQLSPIKPKFHYADFPREARNLGFIGHCKAFYAGAWVSGASGPKELPRSRYSAAKKIGSGKNNISNN